MKKCFIKYALLLSLPFFCLSIGALYSEDITVNTGKLDTEENSCIISDEIINFLGGVWSFYDTANNERKLSWGVVPITDDYIIFDFFAEKPLIIHGYSEGGPGFDHLIGVIDEVVTKDNCIVILFRRITSWQPFTFKDDYYIDISQITKYQCSNTIENFTIYIDFEEETFLFEVMNIFGYSSDLVFMKISE